MIAENDSHPDRFLDNRADGKFRYVRRVPTRFAVLDGRGRVRKSLHTNDLALARKRRDAQEAADNEYWAMLAAETDRAGAEARYAAASARAAAIGFRYEPLENLAEKTALADLLARIEAYERAGGPDRAAAAVGAGVDRDALLGLAPRPEVTVKDAFKTYVEEIEAPQKRRKSEAQYRSWLKVKKRALNNFIAVVGDKALYEITRDDARLFWRWWNDRVEAGEVTPNSAARDFGNMRKLFREYMKWTDDLDTPNPFRNLGFGKGEYEPRPPFETKHIRDVILAPGALAGLNEEARRVVLVMIETGARPSELANLQPEDILLDHKTPHIWIRAKTGEGKREIKTAESVRKIPVLGVAAAALKASPQGFPRYHDKGDALSRTVLKFFSENGLFPTDEHTFYSFRHSFEKRMTEAGLDFGLRARLMGHKVDRPTYGDGGSLEWRAAELKKITLPFDAAVV